MNSQKKKRIYEPIKNLANVYVVKIWNGQQYAPPTKGKRYLARKTVTGLRTTKYFETLPEARYWLYGAIQEPEEEDTTQQGPQLRDIWKTFQEHSRWRRLSQGTQANYQKYVRLHLAPLMTLPVLSITPKVIDGWLQQCHTQTPKKKGLKPKLRQSFKHELSALRTLLDFYGEYVTENSYALPLKKRHSEDAVYKKAPPKIKDLTEEEFLKFREALQKSKHGPVLHALATVQFYQSLRISEVAALHSEDIKLFYDRPESSHILVRYHLLFPRNRTQNVERVEGFKNAQGGEDSVKKLPLFPEAYEALRSLSRIGVGPLFLSEKGGYFTYRMLQHAYNKAFKKVGLPYRSTHILRHGGCRKVYNDTRGDLDVAQQLLGNADPGTARIYAKRHSGALRSHCQEQWEKARTT